MLSLLGKEPLEEQERRNRKEKKPTGVFGKLPAVALWAPVGGFGQFSVGRVQPYPPAHLPTLRNLPGRSSCMKKSLPLLAPFKGCREFTWERRSQEPGQCVGAALNTAATFHDEGSWVFSNKKGQ